MPLRLRTFKVSESEDLQLANRAVAHCVPKAEIVREFVDDLLQLALEDIPFRPKPEELVLRSYSLTPEQDRELQRIADEVTVSKGQVFRAVLAHGLHLA